jgi:putative oxidoreductase
VIAQSKLQSLAPLALRLGVGIVLAVHGWQKVDEGVAGFQDTVQQLGLPAPELVAYAVVALELGGGIMLIAGLATRLVAALATLQFALISVWIKPFEFDVGLIAPQDAPGTGFELDLLLAFGSLALVFLGPGLASLDAAFGIDPRRRSEPVAERRAVEERHAA